ncbi:MAG: hypothetical protein ACOX41_07690 [Anaerovoracaceae bacterium]|jgi:hypothetical protein
MSEQKQCPVHGCVEHCTARIKEFFVRDHSPVERALLASGFLFIGMVTGGILFSSSRREKNRRRQARR